MGRPKGSVNKLETDSEINNVAETTLEDVFKSLQQLNDKFDRMLEGRVSERPLPEVEVKEEKPKEQFPIPIEYRMIVAEILNKDFELELGMISDSPAFEFIIVVPQKYSNLSDEYIKMYKRDIRPKVIPYAEGAMGVRLWAERVFNSFNPTIQALIVNDRTP